jgi:hypothetical protein
VNEKKAELWLKKLEKGRVLKVGWPKYHVGLARSGALVVRFSSTNSGNIEQEAQRLRDMGLEEGVHFSAKMPEDNREGYVSILKEAWPTPLGFLSTALANSRDLRRSSWSTYFRGLRRRARRSTKKSKRS